MPRLCGHVKVVFVFACKDVEVFGNAKRVVITVGTAHQGMDLVAITFPLMDTSQKAAASSGISSASFSSTYDWSTFSNLLVYILFGHIVRLDRCAVGIKRRVEGVALLSPGKYRRGTQFTGKVVKFAGQTEAN